MIIEADIKGFKFLNQNYGEEKADELIKYFSEDVPGMKVPAKLCDIYVTVIRGVPMVVLLLIFYFVILKTAHEVPVCIIAFGINSGAYMAELIRSGINAVDAGQMEAGRSLGLNWAQTMVKIIMPQAFRTILPTFTSEFIALIKETSVASFIAVMDLQKSCDNIRNATYNAWIPLLCCAAIYLVLTVGLTKVFSVFEKRLAKSDRS